MKLLQLFKVREQGNLEFWTSHLLIMASTVIGVYLAAQAGYMTAMQFEVARGERDAYYMRRALLDELKDNLDAVKSWGQDFQQHLDRDPAIQAHQDELKQVTDPQTAADGQAWVSWWKAGAAYRHTALNDNPAPLKLSTFTWDTLKQQSSTFQLPAGLVSSVRRYYASIEDNMQDVATRARLQKTGAAAVAIWQDTRRMQLEVLPGLEKEVAEVRAELARKGIPVK
jgi:hypothetical protein